MMKKILLTVVLSFVFGITQTSHPDFLVAKNQAAFVDLYKSYLDNFSEVEAEDLDTFKGFKEGFTLDVFKVIMPHLNIDLSIEEIKEKYTKTGFIQFRHLDPGCRTLVIGCGNRPFSYFGRSKELVFDPFYSNAHAHRGAITIDPDPKNNPTIVAFFGVRPLSICDDALFDKILIEAISIPALFDLKYFESDLKRLLTQNGKLYLSYNSGPFSVSFVQLARLSEAWIKWSEQGGEDPINEIENKNELLLPEIFKKMIDTSGHKKVKELFKTFLEEANWVHQDKTLDETFALINANVKEHNSFLASIKRFFGMSLKPFTFRESRLVRLIAMELDVL